MAFPSTTVFTYYSRAQIKCVNASFKTETENMPENKIYKGAKTNLDSGLFGKRQAKICEK